MQESDQKAKVILIWLKIEISTCKNEEKFIYQWHIGNTIKK